MKRVLAFALLLICFVGHARPQSPNVVIFLADDLGYGDVGCYGAPDIKTPHIDRLAREGVRFTDFYANGSVCTPTRCALMTGRYQQHIGGLETAIPPGAKQLGLPAQEKTIADLLRGVGYATAISGKWHLGYKPEMMPNAHGFDHFFGLVSGNHDYFSHKENNGEADLFLEGQPVEIKGYSTHLITEYALKFLEQMKSKPFFLYVSFNAPHFPAQGPEDASVKPERSSWNRGTRATYIKMVEEMDKGIGKVLDQLERDKLTTNTLVVFMSDNGGTTLSRNAPLNKGKASLWEGGIRVPCVARFPGKIPAGNEIHQVGITMDWTATIAKLAGAKTPRNRDFEGIDLMPLISGQSKQVGRTLFWRSVNFDFTKLYRAVRDGDWKYIESYNGKGTFLYNLANDLGEKEDLLARNPEMASALKKKLDQWEKQMDPPYSIAEPSVKSKESPAK